MEDAQQMSEPKLSNELRQIAHDIGVHGDPTRFHQLADMVAALEARLEAMEQLQTAVQQHKNTAWTFDLTTGLGVELQTWGAVLRALADVQQEKEE